MTPELAAWISKCAGATDECGELGYMGCKRRASKDDDDASIGCVKGCVKGCMCAVRRGEVRAWSTQPWMEHEEYDEHLEPHLTLHVRSFPFNLVGCLLLIFRSTSVASPAYHLP